MKRLGLSGRPDKAALVEAARGDATLDQASERSFREVLDQMTRVQSRMVQRRPERVRQADLQRAARWVAHVLSAARETQG
jgi:hypothetical protein